MNKLYKEPIPQEIIDGLPNYMRVRHYVCEECGKECWEIVKKNDTHTRLKCPHCGKHALDAVIDGAPIFSIANRTVGAWAENNTHKYMGKYELEDRRIDLESNSHRNVNDKRTFRERMRKMDYEVLDKAESPTFGDDWKKRDEVRQMTEQEHVNYIKGKKEI